MSTELHSWLGTRLVSPEGVLSVLAVLRARGHDVEATKRAGPLPADFEQTCPRIALPVSANVWRHAIQTCPDPALGIQAAEQALANDPGLLDFLLRASPTLSNGMRDKARFVPLGDELSFCAWEEDDETGTFVYGGSARLYLPTVAEFAAARLVGSLRRESSDALSPLVVRFIHDAPGCTEAHRRFFRARLEFGSPYFSVTFPLAPLRRASPTSAPALYRLLLQCAEEQLATVMRPRSVAERVRELVMRMWERGTGDPPSRAEVAQVLGVAPRTLSRWLEADGKTYSDLIEETRAVTATRSLQRPETSLVRLAQELGFNDQSAFTHAFRRWTGMTPGQYRRQNREPRASGASETEGLMADAEAVSVPARARTR